MQVQRPSRIKIPLEYHAQPLKVASLKTTNKTAR